MPVFPHTGLAYVPPQGTAARPEAPRIEDVIREAVAMDNRTCPATGRLGWLTRHLRRFISVAVVDVEAEAGKRPVDDPVRVEALAAVREAGHKVGLGPGDGYASAVTYARSLGRGAEELLRQQRRLRTETAVPLAGMAGPGVIVVPEGDPCAECQELAAERHTLELAQDWRGMRGADDRLAVHQRTGHASR
ncbi:DUF6415 family natural product biosynthesis protein [Streptomyces sp. UNOC14_S4]|uniref:DUF6415 family natural product biosynthesis protein n=1 Tax=Streptomyces sp. UNOC14_S4 TaxID=2872340 RepID=UPI001E5E3EFC|nr:DUF6415 family natural product biosynthesis protein [Streptomyces sp. UNOC14_S4]MCC3770550.1 hypothetical protein [Streptomyces sp. UNOC14_S4]